MAFLRQNASRVEIVIYTNELVRDLRTGLVQKVDELVKQVGRQADSLVVRGY